MQFWCRTKLFSESAQRYTRLTIKWDVESGRILNPRDIASHSGIGWGKWQQSVKLDSEYGECWNVATAGHGGVILVTNQPLPFKAYCALDVQPVESTEERYQHLRLYVYEFEEDCDWAVLLYHDKRALDSFYHRIDFTERFYQQYPTPEVFKEEQVVPCVERWHPQLIEEVAA